MRPGKPACDDRPGRGERRERLWQQRGNCGTPAARAVYGDLAYDLDRAALEHALRHAGEAPRRQAEEAPAPKARPRARVRSLTKAEARQHRKVSVLSFVGVCAAIGLAVTVLMGYIQLTAISAEVVDLQNQLEALETEKRLPPHPPPPGTSRCSTCPP